MPTNGKCDLTWRFKGLNATVLCSNENTWTMDMVSMCLKLWYQSSFLLVQGDNTTNICIIFNLLTQDGVLQTCIWDSGLWILAVSSAVLIKRVDSLFPFYPYKCRYCIWIRSLPRPSEYLLIHHSLQWTLDFSFLKGTEKMNEICAKTKNPKNHFF
jgi:hypothetical protein